MNKIKFSREEKQQIVKKVETYFSDELDQEIGNLEAEFLIDFFVKEIGAFIYNRGLNDAHTLFTEKVEELGYTL